MEPDFDKEIDALLRKETVGRTITISEFGGIHLDADEITAFAEKKVPPGVRNSFIEHFAACDRCRKVLLNAAWLNAEEEPAQQPVIGAPAAATVPWYRRLLLFPNLAYVMGGLVVLFAGFIGTSVIYNGFQGRSAQISQVEYDEAPSSGPSAAAEPGYAANSNATVPSEAANNSYNAAAASANTTSTANSALPYAANRVAPQQAPAAEPLATPAPRDEAAKERSEPTVTAAAPAKRDDAPAAADPDTARRIMQDRRTAADAEEKNLQARRTTPMATPAPKAVTRNERPKAQAAEADLSMTKVERPPAPVSGGSSTFVFRKQVSGRTFERRQNAWYDTSYRGQGTINVRRNTDAYRKLDRGLRGIAESIVGTVVTVWNGKAYRIE